MEEQVCVIYAGVKGHLDTLPMNKISTFEADLLRELRASKSLLETIRKEEKLSDASEAKLKEAIDTVKKRLV
jgi:F0F1-type ATP synthase alpha subunit